MNAFEVAGFPAEAAGQTGWPWVRPADAAPSLPDASWPKISIVMPSFNQAAYLEEAIRSVLLQDYPNLEFFVIDGGSTDGSVAVIQKYEKWLSGWCSERDRGQSDAINKGFARCSGEIFNWLCSDDLLEPGALRTVGRAFAESPGCDVVVGDCYCKFELDPQRSGTRPSSLPRLLRSPYVAAIWQPSCFFRRRLIARPRLVRDDLHFCMDRELWCYLHQRGARWKHVAADLSVNRFTGVNKSVVGRQKIIAEIDELYRCYEDESVPLTWWLRHIWLPLVKIQKRHRWAAVRLGSRLLSSTVSVGLRVLYPVDRLKLLRAEYYGYEMW
jgi:glycosyltransferase involved in cell wall biosynthesis